MDLLVPKVTSSEGKLRVGFVPLIDSAPLMVAKETGIFEDYGLSVNLVRQPGWASVRDKITSGELDASHAICGLAFAITYGIGCVPVDCLSGFLLNTHGDGITVSNALWDAGVRSAPDLAAELQGGVLRAPLVFGVVHPHSTHNFLLRAWLCSAGLVPGEDVKIVTVPPPLMGRNLESGNLDGYCVGEPWNTVSAEAGQGRCITTSAELCPMHPEKLLLVKKRFAEDNPETHLNLITALLEACVFCDDPDNREKIASLLSRPAYIGLPKKLLLKSLRGDFSPGDGEKSRLHLFSGEDVNRPSGDKASWILNQMSLCGAGVGARQWGLPAPSDIFRPDLYEQAVELRGIKT